MERLAKGWEYAVPD